MQHRATKNAHGRHRRTAALVSHRAPAQPIAGRYAVAAALVAGVGVATLGTAADSASSSPAGAAPRASLAASPALSLTPETQPTLGAADLQFVAQGSKPVALPFVVQGRKAKPLPQWVSPMPEGAVTSCFGQRWGRLHAGVDLAAPHGTPIHAAGAGVIVAAGEEQGYGNAVLIDHGNGYLTHYGHMSAITVEVGRHVAAGDEIGAEGSTGHSTGPHLHFEVHQGTYQNPVEPTAWMHAHGVDIPGCA